jgi:hypothetical protein
MELEIVSKYPSVEFGLQETISNDYPANNLTPTVVWFLLYLIQLTRHLKVKNVFFIQWKPLNRINLGQSQTEYNNQLIILSE